MNERNSNSSVVKLLIATIVLLVITILGGVGYMVYSNMNNKIEGNNNVEDNLSSNEQETSNKENKTECPKCEEKECPKCENSTPRVYRFFGYETGKQDYFDMYTMLVLYDNTFEFYANRLGGILKFTGTYTENNSSIIIKLSDNSEYKYTSEEGTQTITFTKVNGDKELSFPLKYATGFDAGSHFNLLDSVYNN